MRFIQTVKSKVILYFTKMRIKLGLLYSLTSIFIWVFLSKLISYSLRKNEKSRKYTKKI